MKKIFQYSVIAILIGIVFNSCSTTQKVMSNTAGASRGKFVGTWVCNTVTFQDIIGGAVSKVFDQASPAAFENSTWVLTNSGNGQYTLANGTSQSIFWSYNNPGNGVEPTFQFKKIFQGDKPKNVDTGYNLIIGSIDSKGMVLKSPVTIGSKIGYVVYTFTKTK
jgi:hypothetical protein